MIRSHSTARFDDLRAAVAWELGPPAFVLETSRPDEIAPLLAELERATVDGWWAYGFLAYEAAGGLDPGLAVHPGVDGLPLAWFGVCAAPVVAAPVRPSGTGSDQPAAA